MIELSPENRVILASIPLQPTAEELEQLNALLPQVHNWDYLASNITDRGIAPLLHVKLPALSNASLIPEHIKWHLKQAYYKSLSRGAVLSDYFTKVATAFTEQGIELIALKGVYLSESLYKNIALRQFSDIDLLIKAEDANRCLELLSNMGYLESDSGESDFVKSQVEIIHYPPMVKDGVSIEIHIKLHATAETYHLATDRMWQNAQPATINGTPAKVLSPHDILIHLCVHLDKHFKIGHVQFTCFMDIANYLREYETSIDWAIFSELCVQYNAESAVYKYLVLANRYMNAPLPADVLARYASTLTEGDEALFVKYLGGYTVDKLNTVPSHLRYLKLMTKPSDRIRYVWEVVFPPRSFMIPKYHIKNSSHVWLYYPYRWWKGIRGLFSVISKQ